MKRLLTSVIILSATVCQNSAQSLWTLEQCIERASSSSRIILEKKNSYDRALCLAEAKKALFLPAISACAESQWNWGRSVDMQELVITRNKLTYGLSGSLGAEIILFEGGRKILENAIAKAEVGKAGLELGSSINSVSVETTRLYLQILMASEMVEISKIRLKSIVDERDRTEKLISSGKQPQCAILSLQSKVAGELKSLSEYEFEARKSRFDMTEYLNLPYSSDFQIEPINDTLMSPPPILTVDEIMSMAENDWRTQAAYRNVKLKKLELAAAKSRMYPAIALNGGYGTYYSSASSSKVNSQIKENTNPSVNLSLSIPIFSRLENITQDRLCRIAVKEAEEDAQKVKSRVAKELTEASDYAFSLYEQYHSSLDILHSQKENMTVIREKYHAGNGTSTDLILALNETERVEKELVITRYRYLLQLKTLELMLNCTGK